MSSIPKTYQHCGPIKHPGMNVTVDEHGIQSKGFAYDNKKAVKPLGFMVAENIFY